MKKFVFLVLVFGMVAFIVIGPADPFVAHAGQAIDNSRVSGNHDLHRSLSRSITRCSRFPWKPAAMDSGRCFITSSGVAYVAPCTASLSTAIRAGTSSKTQ